MEEERLVSGRENPRHIGFANCNSTNKSMPNEVAIQKPAAPILDRFKAMLKEREEELRVSAEDDVPPPTTEEIVRLYDLLLSELTFNSKPIITDLTIIAGEQREHGDGIADAICARIIEVAVDQKLPSLYLLDSIVKNIGREYVRYFSSRLPEVFCEAYRQVHPNQYQAMRHLFGTWSTVFPISVLRKIEAQLQFSPSVNQQSSGLTPLRASESPRPTLGIHVNPKYLEARHEFELSTKDSNIQHAKGSSSALNIYGQNHATGYDGYDSDNTETISSQVGAQILSSSDRAGRASLAPSTEKLPASSVARLGRTSDLFRIGQSRTVSSPLEEFAVDNSPRRIAERVSPSYHGLENGLGRVINRDEETSERWRNHWSDETNQRFEASTGYNYGNRVELQGPRALIDAYGNDRGKGIMSNKHLKVERLDINGIDSKLAPKTWQNSEEEEFDWEDMSPTLAGHNRSSDLLLSSNKPSGSFRTRPGLGRRNAASVETDFRRSSLSIPAQLPMVDDSSIALEDAVPTIGSGRGAIGKFTGPRNGVTQNMGSRYAHEALNLPRYLPQSSQHQLNAKGSGRNLHMPFPAGEQKALIDSYSDMNAQLHGPLTVGSRMGSSSLDSLNPEARSAAATASTGVWPPVNMQKIHALPLLPSLPLQKQIRSQFDSTNSSSTFMNPSLNKSFLPEQLNSVVNKVLSSAKLPQFPNEQAGSIPLNMQNPQVIPLQPQLIVSQGVRQNSVLPAAVPLPSPFVIPQMNHGYVPQGNAAAISTLLSNPVPSVHSSMPILNISNRSMQGGALPPLPPGPPPASSQMMQAISQNPGLVAPIAPVGSGFSGLFNSLMAQGLISLTNEASVQDSVGLDFNPDLLKVRHESVIRALYGDLPRQCTACGLRFKCQEEHSSHMDWHVTKNRVSKNRKQKASRKWFVSVEMWLSGAEALGTDVVPGFLPTENIVEEKDDEELAVPADEDQEVCALCGEHFDDFYSDETEEWMYKGAVYMNAPDGSTAGMDRSQLGPIVHAKCRSVSSGVSPEDFAQDEGGQTEEGSQRKRMRSYPN